MNLKSSYAIVVAGILLGVFGFVRSSAIAISIGGFAVTYLRFKNSKKKRKIELIIPIALAVNLFVVALTLPHGK